MDQSKTEQRKNPERGEMWRHFKGGVYVIVGMARDEADTSVNLVVYGRLDTEEVEQPLWVRPLISFMGTVERDDFEGNRFELVPVELPPTG